MTSIIGMLLFSAIGTEIYESEIIKYIGKSRGKKFCSYMKYVEG